MTSLFYYTNNNFCPVLCEVAYSLLPLEQYKMAIFFKEESGQYILFGTMRAYKRINTSRAAAPARSQETM